MISKHTENVVRKVILNMTMTLDGFFCGPNGELNWMSQTPDQELNDDVIGFFQNIDEGFIGYPTACGMLPYWQEAARNPDFSKEERAIAHAVNTLHPFILSNQEEKLQWENTTLLVIKSDDDLVKAVQTIKQHPGKNLGLPGGIRTAQTFVRLNLIDEYVLMVHPVTIGTGKRVFTEQVNLKLVDTRTYKSGVMRLCYQPDSHYSL